MPKLLGAEPLPASLAVPPSPPTPWFVWAMVLGIGSAVIYALLPPERLPPRSRPVRANRSRRRTSRGRGRRSRTSRRVRRNSGVPKPFPRCDSKTTPARARSIWNKQTDLLEKYVDQTEAVEARASSIGEEVRNLRIDYMWGPESRPPALKEKIVRLEQQEAVLEKQIEERRLVSQAMREEIRRCVDVWDVESAKLRRKPKRNPDRGRRDVYDVARHQRSLKERLAQARFNLRAYEREVQRGESEWGPELARAKRQVAELKRELRALPTTRTRKNPAPKRKFKLKKTARGYRYGPHPYAVSIHRVPSLDPKGRPSWSVKGRLFSYLESATDWVDEHVYPSYGYPGEG
jgi:hypothetical protein